MISFIVRLEVIVMTASELDGYCCIHCLCNHGEVQNMIRSESTMNKFFYFFFCILMFQNWFHVKPDLFP